jgi:lipopolysaccharide/colanic/teichoic acid biosynthesis glycosyltransferase
MKTKSMAKRVFDIIFALFIIFFFSWFLLILCLIAAADTSTNGIFVQKRIGQFGKLFTIYKLRTIQNSIDKEEKHISTNK